MSFVNDAVQKAAKGLDAARVAATGTTVTVDRIEGDVAVIERGLGDFADVPLASLPAGTHEGTVLTYDGSVWKIDEDEERSRREKIAALKASLFHRKSQES